MYRITLNVDGMMCSHCEKHVNDEIAARFDVESVSSSHEEDTTVIVSREPISEFELGMAIDAAGYKLLGMKTEES
ncbi:MAG: heavy-metal-associated domain-containing protein [Clostridia bacterium]|nr:heavy-metal-associated domain-containing protein [Clostridia bacterium]